MSVIRYYNGEVSKSYVEERLDEYKCLRDSIYTELEKVGKNAKSTNK